MGSGLRLAKSAVVIGLPWATGEAVVRGSGLPVPGAVVGLVILFLLFAALPRLVQLAEPAGALLLRQFPLFLYPLGAGFLTLGTFGSLIILKIALAIACSLLLSLLAGAFIFRLATRHE